MRNTIIVGLFLLLISCGERPNSVIRGEIKGAENTMIYIEQINVAETKTIDSTKINKKGEFSFKLHVDLPTFYALKFSNGERVTLILDAEEKQEISGSLEDIKNNYWVDGSDNSLWIKLLNFQLNRTTTVTDSILKAYSELPEGENFAQERREYSKSWEDALKKQLNFTHEFILKHAISPASYYALYQRITPQMFILDEIDDFHYFKVVGSSMNALYPESQYTKALMKQIGQISKAISNKNLITAINKAESSLPDIKLPTLRGDTISLNSLKNKLIVIDFALLTNSESKPYITEMKKVYNKFKRQGVEIYQVCLDKSKIVLENVIENNKIDWICVWDEEGTQSRAAMKWNIKEIPANYIINQNSEIVGKNLYGDRLAERLSDLLKQ